jgi:acyl-CoA dehydrogenase
VREAIRETAAGFVRREVVPHLADWEADTAEPGFSGCRVLVAHLVGEENTGFYQIAQQFGVEPIGGGATEVLTGLAARLMGYA